MKKILILTWMLSGCATVGTTVLQEAPPKPEDCDLQVFASENEVGREFVSVCLLDARTGTSGFKFHTAQDAIEIAKPHACKCGGDAVVLKNNNVNGKEATATLSVISFSKSLQAD